MEDVFEITTNDLDLIKQLIEVSTKNGLISPNALTPLGNLYDRIVHILIDTDSNISD